jgi:hypothetical protein
MESKCYFTHNVAGMVECSDKPESDDYGFFDHECPKRPHCEKIKRVKYKDRLVDKIHRLFDDGCLLEAYAGLYYLNQI